MPPPLLLDFATVASDTVIHDRESIYEMLPHRHEFQLLDGVCFLDEAQKDIVAFCDVTADDWWVKAHFPQRALLPGVLMLEMAAHASALMVRIFGHSDALIVFGGVDKCKFRDQVVPGSRLHILAHSIEIRSRRVVADTQGVVDGRLVFEARVTGLMT